MFIRLSGEDVASSIITYEPIWTTGMGGAATSEDVQEVCGAIRRRTVELYDDSIADVVWVQYGGPVKSSNVVKITVQLGADGTLVSGASPKADEFVKTVTYYR